MNTKRSVLDLIKKEALTYALYTIEQRAIPNMIDGLKPVQRFFIHSALKGKGEFRKVAAVGGSVAELGYHHGETSANDSGSLMCAEWANNKALLDGRGFFGSRLVKKPSQPRYIYCKPSSAFSKMYQDMDLVPEHADDEHEPPMYYLPIVPVVLLNGVSGIAKAYATNIPPHSLESITEGCIAYLKGKPFSLEVTYPQFTGTVVDGTMYGVYELQGKTKLIINEIPYKYDREKYITVLDKMEEKGLIVSYEDQSKEGFKFVVTLKREYAATLDHNKILNDFKLSENVNPNINVIRDGKLEHFDTSEDLLKSFVDFRIGVYEKRIAKRIADKKVEVDKAQAKLSFITHMIEYPDLLKGKTRSQSVAEINNYQYCNGYGEMLVGMSIYHLTEDESDKLLADLIRFRNELDYWENTTANHEYLNDLKELSKKMK